MMELDAVSLVFWILSFKPAFPLSTFTFIKKLFTSFLFSAVSVVSSAYLRLLISLLVSAICEPRNSRCSSWILERQRNQISNCQHPLYHRANKRVAENIYFCFINYTKTFDCVDHNKLWKLLKVMGIPDDLTCFLRNLYAFQEATVRTRHGIMDWFQIGKRVWQGCILSPAYLTYMQGTSCKMPG